MTIRTLELDNNTVQPSTLEHIEAAIANSFPHEIGRMHVRELWSRMGVRYFRVNWWRERGGEEHIVRSAFVAVQETSAGVTVQEITTSNAA